MATRGRPRTVPLRMKRCKNCGSTFALDYRSRRGAGNAVAEKELCSTRCSGQWRSSKVRNMQVRILAESGRSYEEIGRKFGITRARVGQIVNAAG